MSTGHRAHRSVLRTLLLGFVMLAVLAPSTVAHADPTLAEIEAQLDKSNQDLEATIEAWNGINADLATTQAKVADLQAKLKPLQDGVDATSANVEQFAIAQFKTAGNMQALSAILNARDTGSLMDQMSMLQQITHSQQKDIENYRNAKSKYDSEKQQLDELLAAQTTQKSDIENKRKLIEGDIKKLQDLQKKATAAGSKKVNPPAYNPGTLPPASGKAGAAVAYAKAQLGKPYVFGAAGPNSFDCSGLTMAAWKAAGVSLTHQASRQFSEIAAHYRTSTLPFDKLEPGDLIFYNGLGHVGIYVGNKSIIHAPHTGTVVQYASATVDSVYGWARPQ
ncbi:NlpC/P60 family protein [Dactylosporangium salmoneum]|uniref:C40 family peptidase n=1 Tax=Dactylosporangium salmoneum TaxID=53361 RepID=A0ABP5T5Y8_9ACTN